MGYQDSVQKILSKLGHRVAEREEIWQSIVRAYAEGGAEAVAKKLSEAAGSLQDEFRMVLKSLESKL